MYGITEVLFRGKIAQVTLKRILRGVMYVLIGAAIGFVGLLAGIAALFFQLADLFSYVQPAIITGVVAILIAAVLFIQGFRHIDANTRR